jgi:hypothetical protein
LIALNFSQKVLNFCKICTPKFLGCYSHVTGASRGGYDARRIIEEIRRKESSTAGENDGFPTFSA